MKNAILISAIFFAVSLYPGENIIHLGEFNVSLDPRWMIMHHDPLTPSAKAVSVVVVGEEKTPVWSLTYIFYDLNTQEGVKMLRDMTYWHNDTKSREVKDRTLLYFGKPPKNDSLLTCIDHIQFSEGSRTCKLVRMSRKFEEGDDLRMNDLFDECIRYAQRFK